MANYKIGYGKPPKGKPFSPGKSGNPLGRPPRTPNPLGEIVQEVLDGDMEYRKNGKAKKGSRQEVSIKVLVDKAVKGDVIAAQLLFNKRAHAARHRQKGTGRVLVVNWLPDYFGQTAEEKARNLQEDPGGRRDDPPDDEKS